MRVEKINKTTSGSCYAWVNYDAGECVLLSSQEWKKHCQREKDLRNEIRRLKRRIKQAGLTSESLEDSVK